MARASAVIASLALGVGVAACGGEQGTDGVARLEDGTTTAGEQQAAAQDFEDAALAYAQCMRERGVDMPDPTDGGFVITPDTDPTRGNKRKFRSADGACRKHLANVKPPKLSEADKEAFQKAALEHARCMREHGIEFPDPTLSDEGGASISLGDIDVDDPKFKAAQKACETKLRAVMGGAPSDR